MKNLKTVALSIGICGTIFSLWGGSCWLCGSDNHLEPGEACNSDEVVAFLASAENGIKIAEKFLIDNSIVWISEEYNSYYSRDIEVRLKKEDNLISMVLAWYLKNLKDKRIALSIMYDTSLVELACTILKNEKCYVVRVYLWDSAWPSVSLERAIMPEDFFKVLCMKCPVVKFRAGLRREELDALAKALEDEDGKTCLSELEFEEFFFQYYDWKKFGESLQKNYSLSKLYMKWDPSHSGVAQIILGTHLNELNFLDAMGIIEVPDVLRQIYRAFDPEKGRDLPPNLSFSRYYKDFHIDLIARLITLSKTLECISWETSICGEQNAKTIAGAIIRNFINDGRLYKFSILFECIGSTGIEALYLAVVLNPQMVEIPDYYIGSTLFPEISQADAIVRAKKLKLIDELEAKKLRQKFACGTSEKDRGLNDLTLNHSQSADE